MKAEIRTSAYGLLAAIILLWGVNWPIMKVGIQYMPPVWFAAARVLLGCLCLFIFLAARNRLRLPHRQDFPAILSVALLQLTISLSLVHVGLQFVDAGRSAILAYTMPLWVTPLAVFWLKERLDKAKWVGLALGLGGVGVLFNPTVFDFQDSQALLGNGLLLLSALLMAVVIVHMRIHRGVLSSLQLMPWQMLLGGVLLAAIATVVEAGKPVTWEWPLVLILAYNGPVASAFCFWAYITVMRGLPVVSTSVGSLGVPVSGVFFSALLLDEPLSISRISGLALILAGVAAVSFSDFRRR